MFDPFITPNELAAHINIEEIRADFILLSHGHADHVADCVAIAEQNNATVVGAFEVMNWMAAQGVKKTHPMNLGGQWNFDFGTVKCTNAIHSSNMPDGSYGGNPMGFIVTTPEKTVLLQRRHSFNNGYAACSALGKIRVLRSCRSVTTSRWDMKMQLLLPK